MAGVPERLDTFFRLSPVADSRVRCFAVRRGDVNARALSAPLYSPELQLFLQRLARHPAAQKPLHSFVDINPPVDFSGLQPDSIVSFIPMDSVADGATGEVNLLSRPLSDVQKGYTPFTEGDILWAKITPCMQNGKSCIARGLENGIGFGSTEFHVFRPLTAEVSTEFIWEFLNQETLRRVAPYTFTGSAGHQRVPASFLAELPFPKLPKKEQDRLVGFMAVARTSRRTKQAEADALLAGLDNFLLETFGFAQAPKDNRKIFAVRRDSVFARFDPHFHLPAFAQNIKMLADYGSEPLGNFTTFSEEIWKPEKHEAPTFRYIEISNVNTTTGEARAEETLVAEAPSRARMVVRQGDIIVSLTRPHHGAIAQITTDLDDCVASTGFSVLRGVDERRVSRDYLWCVLRSKMCLDQMLQRASGGNYPAITQPELAKVLVPVPDPAVQETIAAESRRRRDEAKRLREEAETAWTTAKEKFEQALLSEKGD